MEYVTDGSDKFKILVIRHFGLSQTQSNNWFDYSYQYNIDALNHNINILN